MSALLAQLRSQRGSALAADEGLRRVYLLQSLRQPQRLPQSRKEDKTSKKKKK